MSDNSEISNKEVPPQMLCLFFVTYVTPTSIKIIFNFFYLFNKLIYIMLAHL